MEQFGRLVGGLIFLIFGIILSLFWGKIGVAMVKSQSVFWKNLNISQLYSSRYETFAKSFILIIGIIFLLAGAVSIYQFFR